MTATTDFVNSVTRNYTRGYVVGSERRKRKGESDVANFSLEDYKNDAEGALPTPEDTPLVGPESLAVPVTQGEAMTGEAISEPSDNVLGGDKDAPVALERPGFGEGGDAESVNKLLATDDGAIDDTSMEGLGENPMDAAIKTQKAIPKVRVVDWEAAKQAKADAYMRAGMSDRAANVEQEFTDLKQRKFQELSSRALQVMQSNPVKAAELLTKASQYSADGTMTSYMPIPGGVGLMEIALDEQTGEAVGEPQPLDSEMLKKFIMMNSDPVKFLYQQVDQDWKEAESKKKQDNWEKDYRENKLQHLDNKNLQWSKLDLDRAVEEGKAARILAEKTGYDGQQWDKKVVELHKFISSVSDPMKFKNEFGPEYGFDMEGAIGTKGGMPDMAKLRGGAEAFMGANGYNQSMSGPIAVDLYLTVSTPDAKAAAIKSGRIRTSKASQPIIQGRDNKWYVIPDTIDTPSVGG
jgi:hypothetical protein